MAARARAIEGNWSLVVILTLCAALSACGASTPVNPPPEPTAAATTPLPTEPVSSETPTAADPTSEVPEASEEPSDGETKPPSLGPADSGRTLQSRDFRSVEPSDANLRDDGFVVGGKDYQGVGVSIDDCGVDDGVMLELRTGSNFHQLTFDFGQDLNLSESSDQILIARVEGDGDLLKTKRTPFKELTSLDADITDVAALKLELYMDPLKCDYEDAITAVLVNVKLT